MLDVVIVLGCSWKPPVNNCSIFNWIIFWRGRRTGMLEFLFLVNRGCFLVAKLLYLGISVYLLPLYFWTTKKF